MTILGRLVKYNFIFRPNLDYVDGSLGYNMRFIFWGIYIVVLICIYNILHPSQGAPREAVEYRDTGRSTGSVDTAGINRKIDKMMKKKWACEDLYNKTGKKIYLQEARAYEELIEKERRKLG